MKDFIAVVLFVAMGLAPIWLFKPLGRPAPSEPTSEEEPVSAGNPSIPGYYGCVADVSELPGSRHVDAKDTRLRADRTIIVLKAKHRVMLFSGGKLRTDRNDGTKPSCWTVALGVTESGAYAWGDKLMQGDRRTPEGWFRTSDKPRSSYENAILVHYPGSAAGKTALRRGSIPQAEYRKIVQAEKAGTIPPQETSLGGNILLHGGTSAYDWTFGCIALEDADLLELRKALPGGMKTWILILP